MNSISRDWVLIDSDKSRVRKGLGGRGEGREILQKRREGGERGTERMREGGRCEGVIFPAKLNYLCIQLTPC